MNKEEMPLSIRFIGSESFVFFFHCFRDSVVFFMSTVFHRLLTVFAPYIRRFSTVIDRFSPFLPFIGNRT